MWYGEGEHFSHLSPTWNFLRAPTSRDDYQNGSESGSEEKRYLLDPTAPMDSAQSTPQSNKAASLLRASPSTRMPTHSLIIVAPMLS